MLYTSAAAIPAKDFKQAPVIFVRIQAVTGAAIPNHINPTGIPVEKFFAHIEQQHCRSPFQQKLHTAHQLFQITMPQNLGKPVKHQQFYAAKPCTKHRHAVIIQQREPCQFRLPWNIQFHLPEHAQGFWRAQTHLCLPPLPPWERFAERHHKIPHGQFLRNKARPIRHHTVLLNPMLHLD